MMPMRVAQLVPVICCIVAVTFVQGNHPQSKVQGELSSEQIQAYWASREKPLKELEESMKEFQAPEISCALGDPNIDIAIVLVTEVQLPKEGEYRTKFKLHLEEFLRGTSKETEFHADSAWCPPQEPSPGQLSVWFGSGGPTTDFDRVEPKVGNHCVVGYSLPYSDRTQIFPRGVINLSTPQQAKDFPDVQRFLTIETQAGNSDTGPYLSALNDAVPFIRDLAAQKLVSSKSCNVSRSCSEAVLTVARELLQSRKPGERWEGLKWLEPLTEPIGTRMEGVNGLPQMSDTTVRELLTAEVADSNLSIGDRAYLELAMFDFHHTSDPGECIEVVPAMRKSARWTKAEMGSSEIGGPLGFGIACIP